MILKLSIINIKYHNLKGNENRFFTIEDCEQTCDIMLDTAESLLELQNYNDLEERKGKCIIFIIFFYYYLYIN
jgi:dsDNA-binding SOS-regulon protein